MSQLTEYVLSERYHLTSLSRQPRKVNANQDSSELEAVAQQNAHTWKLKPPSAAAPEKAIKHNYTA